MAIRAETSVSESATWFAWYYSCIMNEQDTTLSDEVDHGWHLYQLST